MKEFIYNLYANENFPIYLGAIILVLLVAFFVVFFLGKKDKKKIEQTQRLEKINADAFKETSAPVAVETPVVSAPQPSVAQTPASEIVPEVPVAPTPQVETTIAPVLTPVSSETPVVAEAPVAPQVNAPVVETNAQEVVMSEPAVEMQVVPEISVDETPTYTPTPVEKVDPELYKSPQTIDKLIDEKPVPAFNPDPVIEPYVPADVNLENFNNLATSISNELDALEKQQQIAKPIIEQASSPVIETAPAIVPAPEAPIAEVHPPLTKVEEPLEVATTPSVVPTKVTPVFSSVYVPKKEEDLEDTMAIELPKLKTTPVLEETKEEGLKL